MEGEQVADSPSEKITLGQELVSLCKYYMAMGVSWDEFWYGDYCRLKFYEENYYRQKELKNQELWLGGFYNYMAVSSALAQMFNPNAQAKYPEKPIDFETEEKSPEEKQKEAIKRMQAQLVAIQQQWRDTHHE